MSDFNLSQVEDRIRPHVKKLRDAGWETTQSCGHDMYISVKAGPLDILPFQKTLISLGYKHYHLEYCQDTRSPKTAEIKVTFLGDLAGDGRPCDFILLKVDPESHPLYFVINARNRERDHGPNDENHDAYYYNEHTCPTNWTDEIEAVISKGDYDPHGFATFVRRIPVPEKYDQVEADWSELFPEILVYPLPVQSKEGV